MALAHLGADANSFTVARLHRRSYRRRRPAWPVQGLRVEQDEDPAILVGGPEVTSAFVLMGLSLARGVMVRSGRGE
jgi:hypothetical protein